MRPVFTAASETKKVLMPSIEGWSSASTASANARAHVLDADRHLLVFGAIEPRRLGARARDSSSSATSKRQRHGPDRAAVAPRPADRPGPTSRRRPTGRRRPARPTRVMSNRIDQRRRAAPRPPPRRTHRRRRAELSSSRQYAPRRTGTRRTHPEPASGRQRANPAVERPGRRRSSPRAGRRRGPRDRDRRRRASLRSACTSEAKARRAPSSAT